jgi:hypothetical protein
MRVFPCVPELQQFLARRMTWTKRPRVFSAEGTLYFSEGDEEFVRLHAVLQSECKLKRVRNR